MDYKLNILKNAIDNNKLSIFVGAGVSKGTGLPDWSELMETIKKELSLSKENNDYLKIAQFYYLACGESVYYQKIQEFIPDTVDPTVVHKLIFDIKPENVITTNWDNLLEKTIETNGYVYDTISSDTHLVQSQLKNHIIKMHGDFRDNNIVFREDDYINYSQNFPLIENYIKSILSTNVILFLGYSYSDINLKYIMKWLQYSSKVHPPMFLTTFKRDENEIRYLKNYGIDTLVLSDEHQKYNKNDIYTNKVATFLNKLIEDDDLWLNKKKSDKEVVDFVYKRLEPLNLFNRLLPEQVQKKLTNCTFRYEIFRENKIVKKIKKMQFGHTPTTLEIIDYQKYLDDFSIVEKNIILMSLNDSYMTGDLNKKIRELYSKFKEIIQKDDLDDSQKETIKSIYDILIKANIDGIIVSKDDTPSNQIQFYEFFNNFFIDERIYNYDFKLENLSKNSINDLMNQSLLYYQRREYYDAYKLIKEVIIPLCIKQKNYIQLFFSMFNHNRLLQLLKDWNYIDMGNPKGYKGYSETWQYNTQEYDLDKQYYELPKKIQVVLKEVKPFIHFDYLYKSLVDITLEWEKKQRQKEEIEKNRRITWDTNVTRNYSKQKSYLLFFINNNLMFEKTFTFREINKKIIEISLIRQIQNEKITLDKMELFASIKYIKHDDFKEIFKIYSEDKSLYEGKFHIKEKNLNWLIEELLTNVSSLYIEKKTQIVKPFEQEFKNIIFLLALVKLNKYQSSKILKVLQRIIENNQTEFYTYPLINEFIGVQYSLYETNITDENIMINLITNMIERVIFKKGNVFDRRAFEENHINNVFAYLHINSKFFSDKDLIEKLLKEMKNWKLLEQIKIIKAFLISLYNISNYEIQNTLKRYINGVDYNVEENYGVALSCKLALVVNGINNFEEKYYDELKQYFEKTGNNVYSLAELTGQVKYLIEEMNIEGLEKIYEAYKIGLESMSDYMKNINGGRSSI